MSHRTFPIVTWEDHDGMVTAQLLDDPEAAAVAPRRKVALDALKRALADRMRREEWFEPVGILDPELRGFDVPVRPEVRVDGRVFPCAEEVVLRVASVVGEHTSGLRLAVLPRYGIAFYHDARDDLARLVRAYVGEGLRGSTPEALARHLPPVNLELGSLGVPAPKRRGKAVHEDPPELLRVADPLGAPGLKRRVSHPYERDREVAELVRRVERERVGVLLVGESGAGKTAVLCEAARQAEKGGEEDARRRRWWLTSGDRLVAGMRYLGQWEERLEGVVAAIQRIDGVLAIENLRALVTAGAGRASSGMGGFLAPYVRAGELRLVAEVTPTELVACRRDLPELVEAMQVVRVDDLGRDRALAALHGVLEARRSARGPEIDPAVPATLHQLFRRFLPYEVFPGRAAELLRELLDGARREGRDALRPEDVLASFQARTGLPEVLVRDDRPLPRGEVEAALGARVLGQPRAVAAVARRLVTFKAGMQDPGRPLGVFLFCGPTGVGKTQLARTLADYCFGAGEAPAGGGVPARRLLRLDMSEYATPGSAGRLLVGLDGEPSALVREVRRQPFRVLLLDEIEKADPAVFDVLLTLLDEGRLVDADGRVAIFRSAFVIMTSNLGVRHTEPIGFGEEGGASVLKAIRDFFRPEFVNRIDDLVVFDPLPAEEVRRIAALELAELGKREGLAARGLTLAWDDAVLDLLAEAGFHPRYGARPLQRAVERLVAVPVARRLIEEPGASGTWRLRREGARVVLA